MTNKFNKIDKFIAFFLPFMLMYVLTSAEQGTTAAAFLKLDQGVRPVAMGGAFTGAADDVNAIMYNPAGLAQLKKIEVTLMHSFWLQSIFYDYIAVGYPVGEIGTFALSFVYVNSGGIPKTDILGADLGEFLANDINFNLGYGTNINKDLSLGITIKVFNESIDTTGAFGFAADVAGIYKLPVKDLQIGIVAQNLGPKFGFGEAFWLPIMFKVGLSYTGIRNMMLNLDYMQPIETYGILSFGMEYWYRDLLAVRLGYRFQGKMDLNEWYENYSGPDIMAGLVLGAGVKINMIEIDYAYRQFGVLENTHRLGLTLKF